MKKISIIKTGLATLLIFNSIFVTAITFDVSVLKDTQQSNYTQFRDPKFNPPENFEIITADFNGDNIDDMLSMGGALSNMGTGGVMPTYPLAMMLYENGEYIAHDIGVVVSSAVVNIVDIDNDGDLDIVTLGRYILINDGLANFSILEYSSGYTAGNNVFTLDWDNDGDTDIVTQKRIYFNDGNMDFSYSEPSPEVFQDTIYPYYIADINNDGRVDVLKYNGSHLQSWVKDEQGMLNMQSEVELPHNLTMIHELNNDTEKQNFVLYLATSPENKTGLFNNNGEGVFSLIEFQLDTTNIPQDYSFKISKLINKDMNQDGIDELIIATTYKDISDCQNYQNMVYIYRQENEDNWQLVSRLHSEGFTGNPDFGYAFGNIKTPTVIDLNQDGLPDIIFNGDKPVTWLNDKITGTNTTFFTLSNASVLQYNRHIDAADFNVDGNIDVFSSSQYGSECNALDYSENLYSTSLYSLGSKLWLNDGQGGFEPYSSSLGGGNDFLGPHEYTKFADLENSGLSSIIYTATQENGIRFTRYTHPMVFDPPFNIAFPEVTTNVKIANLDNVGEKEIVMVADTEDAPIMVLGYQYPQFKVLQELEFGARNGEIMLADMDNDGNIDIVANTKTEENKVSIWYNDGLGRFSLSPPFADSAIATAIIDIDNDGLLDIFVSNESHDFWINQGNKEFLKLEYNDAFFYNPIGSIEDGTNIRPTKIEVRDFNKDGKSDLLFFYANTFTVYINESFNGNIWFYQVYKTSVLGLPENTNAVIIDINNDEKLDFITANQGSIKINTQVEESITTGLFFDPEYNGHGFSIDAIGRDNLFYSVFYSYDEQGRPQWYSLLNRFVGNEYGSNNYFSLSKIDNNNTISYLYDYNAQSTTINYTPQNTGAFTFSNYFLPNSKNLQRAYYRIGESYDTWNIQPIISESQAPDNDFSGLWWAGVDDAGWGVSLSFVQRENFQEVVAVLYFYDEFGNPRWVMGQSTGFETDQDIVIDMKQINGYGRLQNYVELTEFPAGTITLNLQQAAKELGQAGSMSMDVLYPDDQPNDNWVRNNIPISLFSKPKI
ncbi:MAG: VCBS repeat-containing protein [Proteobacteria bacterium]|nr:VCBS repeat-containing protein [Pseudomonadota bacterium]